MYRGNRQGYLTWGLAHWGDLAKAPQERALLYLNRGIMDGTTWISPSNLLIEMMSVVYHVIQDSYLSLIASPCNPPGTRRIGTAFQVQYVSHNIICYLPASHAPICIKIRHHISCTLVTFQE